MFKNASAWDEVALELEKNLSNSTAVPTESNSKTVTIIEKLNSIAIKLDNLGFTKESEAVTRLIEVVANDTATDNLSYDEMVKNLATRGWMFNAADDSDANQDELEEKYLETMLGNESEYAGILDELDEPEEIELNISESDL